MRFILHIGMPKTGTTAIQAFLSQHRDKLLHKYSLLYPKTGMRDDVVKFPVHSKFHLSILPWGRDKIDPIELKNSLTKEIKLEKPKTVILSSEVFSFFSKEEILEFKEIYDFPITDIVCYIRRQDLLVDSLYRHTIKDYDIRRTEDFKNYLLKLIKKYKRQFSALKYYELVSRWKEIFPNARVIVRLYDRKLFPERNVILDFLSLVGVDISDMGGYISNTDINTTLSHLSALVMRRINSEFDLPREYHMKIVRYLQKIDKEEGSPIKSFFTLQERLEFLEMFRESNEKLFREYFGTENQFVLSQEEIEFYKEQDKIPRDLIDEAFEERYRKVLEFMESNGILAKERLFPKASVNHLSNDLEFFKIDIVNVNLLNGNLNLTIGGVALPKADVENLKLTVKDAEGVKEAQWGLPSPGFGEQRKDNPKAKSARFRVDGVVVSEKPIEVFVNDKKIAEIVIKVTSI